MPNSVDDPPRAPLPETIAGETSDTSPPNGANLEISGEADPSTPAAEGEPQRPRRRRRRHRPSPA
ncbi:MAG: hypothetical protein J2P48_21190, partial [Alphaproteobacteria bacterium]|nr:hypothetical protein [Alphaproteobacteria bacterium]